MGYLCADFSIPRPLYYRVRPDVRVRQTDVRQKHRLMPLPYGGGGIINDDVIDVADLVTIRFRPN